MNTNILVFYAGLLYGEYSIPGGYSAYPWPYLNQFNLPDGCYILLWNGCWYRSDYTPVLLSDVPKELLALVLLLT